MTWEEFRDEEVFRFSRRTFAFYVALSIRASLLYLPFAVAMGYAIAALRLFQFKETVVVEIVLLVIAGLFLVFPLVTDAVLNREKSRIAAG